MKLNAATTSVAPIEIVGGVYREWCMRPGWREIFGSAGRAAVAISAMGSAVRLHAYTDRLTNESMKAQAGLNGFELASLDTNSSVGFEYVHGLATPRITRPDVCLPAIKLHAAHIVRFGMLESDAVVRGDTVVYDPQNAVDPAPFSANGSTARRLALILNRHEASLLTGMREAPVQDMARQLIADGKAALGAFVNEGGVETTVPAYRSGTVWKIGSGDNFVGHFAHRWMTEGLSAAHSADLASKATAYYCSTACFATPADIAAFNMVPVRPSPQYRAGRKPKVYLAGPFFNLAQHWLVEETRSTLTAMGLDVFSPFHEVGHGSAADVAALDLAGIRNSDLVFALGDGLESGTMYELGYANCAGKPVVVYCENESDGSKKMMLGSGCQFHSDFVSAIYNAAWTACEI
jgi:Nucleoside 2-deoxyribosyltransferase